jgi:hypothetical protein
MRPDVARVVYTAYNADGDPLYVGATSHLLNRLRMHERSSAWWAGAAWLSVSEPMNREDSMNAERDLIRALRPPHNIQHNPDRRHELKRRARAA